MRDYTLGVNGDKRRIGMEREGMNSSRDEGFP